MIAAISIWAVFKTNGKMYLLLALLIAMEIVVFSIKKNFMDIQAGDVPATHADVSKLEEYVNFRPKTTVEDGVQKFVDWYLKIKA